jgi:hypothetical protein
MPRKPVGTYIRTMADWWYYQSVTGGLGGGSGTPTAGAFVAFSLYNDGQQGLLIYLDGVDFYMGASPVETYHVAGVDGKEEQPGIPIYSGIGKQPGSLWSYMSDLPPPLYPGPLLCSGAFPASGVTPPFRMRGRGPLAVIKPGYSYAVCALAADGVSNMTATFYWTPVNAT